MTFLQAQGDTKLRYVSYDSDMDCHPEPVERPKVRSCAVHAFALFANCYASRRLIVSRRGRVRFVSRGIGTIRDLYGGLGMDLAVPFPPRTGIWSLARIVGDSFFTIAESWAEAGMAANSSKLSKMTLIVFITY